MTERTKLVVRHLPPNLPEPVFWKTLSPWLDPIPRSDGTFLPPKCTATFKSFVAGKVRKNRTKVDIPSRAYIQFATPDQVLDFHQGYANQVFRDGQGNLTFPKVEFAPYQKVSGPPKKTDNRIGTIEADPDYQAFLEKLKAPATEVEASSNQQENETEKLERPEITPLIEHLRNVRKAAQDAASNAKQQRHSTNTHSSTNKSAPGRGFAGPPQIMKRSAQTSNADSNNPPVGIQHKKPPGDPVTHEQPPHMANQPTSSSKGAAKQSGTTHPASTNQAAASTSNKSRPNKSSKSKRAGRGTEGQQGTPEAHPSKGSNKQVPQQTKAILQPPSKTTNSTQSVPQTSNNDKQPPPSTPKREENSKKDGPDPNATRTEAGGSPKKSGRGGGGGAGVGRGGKGGKQTNPVPASSGRSSSSNVEDPKPADQQPSGSRSARKKLDAPHPSSKVDSNSEAAGARRRLGMALAGIAPSKSSSSGRPSSRKDKEQTSKPSGPPPASSSNPSTSKS